MQIICTHLIVSFDMHQPETQKRTQYGRVQRTLREFSTLSSFPFEDLSCLQWIRYAGIHRSGTTTPVPSIWTHRELENSINDFIEFSTNSEASMPTYSACRSTIIAQVRIVNRLMRDFTNPNTRIRSLHFHRGLASQSMH